MDSVIDFVTRVTGAGSLIDVVTRVRVGITCLVFEVTGLLAGRSRNRGSMPGRDKLFISSPKLPTSVFGTTQPSIKWVPVAFSLSCI